MRGALADALGLGVLLLLPPRGTEEGWLLLPLLGAPAALDDQQAVDLVACKAQEDVACPSHIEAVAEAAVDSGQLDTVTAGPQGQGLVAVYLGGNVATGGGLPFVANSRAAQPQQPNRRPVDETPARTRRRRRNGPQPLRTGAR